MRFLRYHSVSLCLCSQLYSHNILSSNQKLEIPNALRFRETFIWGIKYNFMLNKWSAQKQGLKLLKVFGCLWNLKIVLSCQYPVQISGREQAQQSERGCHLRFYIFKHKFFESAIKSCSGTKKESPERIRRFCKILKK